MRYLVGSPGRIRYSYGVKRNAVETVWLQATFWLKPMLTTGDPSRAAPATSYSPGMVRCAWANR